MPPPKKKLQKNQISIEDYLNHENNTFELIDVRSPSEYLIDHIPGALNVPALTDVERSKVGELYNLNTFQAKRTGAALVCANIAKNLENIWKDKPKSWSPVLYCWRGGDRSKSVAHVLEKVGWRPLVIAGGYKSYRKYVIHKIPECVENLSLVVVCGLTGSGKTKFLNYLQTKKKQVLDLENLACHRGSLLGSIPSINQPTQKKFDSLLLHELKKFEKNTAVYVESESKKIGDIQVPESLIKLMRKSNCLWIETSDYERVKLLCEEYSHFIKNDCELKIILTQLKKINQLSIDFSFENLKKKENLNKLVMDLLAKHYDPAYKKSMKKNYSKLSEAKIIYTKDSKPLNYSELTEEGETRRSE